MSIKPAWVAVGLTAYLAIVGVAALEENRSVAEAAAATSGRVIPKTPKVDEAVEAGSPGVVVALESSDGSECNDVALLAGDDGSLVLTGGADGCMVILVTGDSAASGAQSAIESAFGTTAATTSGQIIRELMVVPPGFGTVADVAGPDDPARSDAPGASASRGQGADNRAEPPGPDGSGPPGQTDPPGKGGGKDQNAGGKPDAQGGGDEG